MFDLSGAAAALDSWLGDTIRATRPGKETLNESGDLVPGAEVVLHDGPGLVLPLVGTPAGQDPTVAEVMSKTGARYQLVRSADAVPLPAGIQVRVTAQGPMSAATGDLLAARFQVVDGPALHSASVMRVSFLKVV